MPGRKRGEEREFIIKEFVKAPPKRDSDDDTDYEAINYWLSVMYAESGTEAGADPSQNKNLQDAVKIPELAIGFSYRLSEKRRRDKFTIDLNKYSLETLWFPFAENVQGLSDCEDCMRTVQLASLIDKNRIISAKLAGTNANDFDEFINYVSIQVRKEHPNGEVTLREITIDRGKFNETANNFQISYPWNGEESGDELDKYQYRTNWSFFGGDEVITEWQDRNLSNIPPFASQTKKDSLFGNESRLCQ